MGAALLLQGCTTVVGETAKKAFGDRSLDDQGTDIRMASGYFAALVEKDKNLALDVSVDVWEQRVLITGALTEARSTSLAGPWGTGNCKPCSRSFAAPRA